MRRAICPYMGGVQTVTVRSEGPIGWMAYTQKGSTGPACAGGAGAKVARAVSAAEPRKPRNRRRTLTSKP